MKIIITKIVVIFLVIAIVANGFIFPKKTEAFLGIGDISFDPAVLAEEIVSLGKTILQWVKENSGKILRDVIAKRLIDYTVDQTITWIQGGGKPKFVSDWKEYLKDSANIAFDEVTKDVNGAAICSPFGPLIKISLTPPKKFSQQLNCTLDSVVANIQDFYNDFNKGSWVAYNALWEPQNNYYGTMLMINNEAILKISQETQAAQNDALAGGGFVSAKECVEKDENGKCIKEQITTPGSTLGATVAKAITSDVDWASNIQSWVSALTNAALDRLIKKGLNAMGTSAESPSTYYPDEYKALAQSQTQVVPKNDQISQVAELSVGWQRTLDRKNRTASSTAQLIDVLGQLQSHNCAIPVLDKDCNYTPSSFASEILIDQAYLQGLNSDIIGLNNKIDAAGKLIVRITNATTSEDMATSDLAFSTFMDAYGSDVSTSDVNDIMNTYYNGVAGLQTVTGASCTNIYATSTKGEATAIVKSINEFIGGDDWKNFWGANKTCSPAAVVFLGNIGKYRQCLNEARSNVNSWTNSINLLVNANTMLMNLANENFADLTQAKIDEMVGNLRNLSDAVQNKANSEKNTTYASWAAIIKLEADEIENLGKGAVIQLAAENDAIKIANELANAQAALNSCIQTATGTQP